ncbi:GGDEF domain-containing protein [Streptomyces sp. NPDC097727]|uniref:GGDEF domain-containing protein n=1 Tax=Streptomyces sp. NPDC097727 TaxID=3366092 RepID=UPI00381973ED
MQLSQDQHQGPTACPVVEPAPDATSNGGHASGFVISLLSEFTNLHVSDADHFNQLNDRHGHAAGDTALAAIGARLSEWAGPRGVADRLGGDEFAALARIEPRHQALRLEHLARLMTRPVPHEGGLLPLSVSLAATPAAVASSDLPTLMRAADAAMYEGKHTGDIVRARPDHARVPSVNGRRAGRPGTAARGRAT